MNSKTTLREAKRALDELLRLPKPDGQARVHLATKTDDGVAYYFLPLKKAPVGQPQNGDGGREKVSASRRFAEVLEGGVDRVRKLQAKGALPPCPHDSTVVPLQGQIEYVDLESVQGRRLAKLLAPLLRESAVPNFDGGDDDVLGALRFYTIHDPGRGLRAFRILSPKVELSRSRRFALIGTGKGGAYDLAQDRIFLFDDAVDCLLLRDRWLFILNRMQFQQMFDYFDVMRAAKERVLACIQDQQVIEGLDDLLDDAGGIAMTTKLAGMEGSPVLAEGGLPDGYWDRVRLVIDLFGLKVRVVGERGAERFVYDPEFRWQLMHLLSDDYLVSPQAPQPTVRGARALHKTRETLGMPVVVQKASAGAAAPAPGVPAPVPMAPPVAQRKGPHKAPKTPAPATGRKGRKPA